METKSWLSHLFFITIKTGIMCQASHESWCEGERELGR
jgi:hypothetical protein